MQHPQHEAPVVGRLQALSRLAEKGRALLREQQSNEGHHLQQLCLLVQKDQEAEECTDLSGAGSHVGVHEFDLGRVFGFRITGNFQPLRNSS